MAGEWEELPDGALAQAAEHPYQIRGFPAESVPMESWLVEVIAVSTAVAALTTARAVDITAK